MSPQMAEAMLNDPLVSLADGKSSPSVKSSQPKLTQEIINTMSPQAVEAMLKNPYVELDTGKKEPMSFEAAKLLKSISDDDFKWLKASTRGNENKAKEHVIKLTASHLRSLIITQKNFAGYEDELDDQGGAFFEGESFEPSNIMDDKIQLSAGWSDAGLGIRFDDDNGVVNEEDLFKDSRYKEWSDSDSYWFKDIPKDETEFNLTDAYDIENLGIITSNLPDLSKPVEDWTLYEIEFNQILESYDAAQKDKYGYGEVAYWTENDADKFREESLNRKNLHELKFIRDAFLATIGYLTPDSAEGDFTPSILNIFDYGLIEPIKDLFVQLGKDEAANEAFDEAKARENEFDVLATYWTTSLNITTTNIDRNIE